MPERVIIVNELEKYFPVPEIGWRVFVTPFSPLTHPALCRISFQVEHGEVCALIGADGSGKSTLLRILATLLVPTRGHARVTGYDVEREPARVRAQLGVVQLWPSVRTLLLFTVILLPLSIVLFSWALRRTKITGTLTHF